MMVHGGTSSSPFGHRRCSDVFLCFSGQDTGIVFTRFLCNALRQTGIDVFMDDKTLRIEEESFGAILRVIEGSRIAIILFSENFALSTWCLDELVHILQCSRTRGQIVLPVFYNVDPSEVRYQRASFEKAMANHEHRFKNNIEKLQTWKRALFEAANLSGWSSHNRYEFELIEMIVKQVSSKLHRTPLYISDFTVGLETRISEVKSLLRFWPGEGIRMVGIHGFGGIGKTTIAKALFNSIVDQFESACFLANIREFSTKERGLEQLQERLLFELVGEENINLHDMYRGITIIKNRLHDKKVLLILDDINNLKQLEALAGDRDWFGPDSVIIITTRDKHLLVARDVENTYEVKNLNHDEAFELFSSYAFKRKTPDAGYMEISNRLVRQAEGHPLTLQVIGSFLFGRSVQEWESVVHRYEKIPNMDVHRILRISFEELEENEKEIFLDIACFFNGETMEYVKKTLVACDYFTIIGLNVLIDRSLLYIDEYNKLRMHNLVRDMGREIVRQESPVKPSKRSRLWDHQDVLEVLSKNTGSDYIRGMLVDLPNQYMVHLRNNTFLKMRNLRILIVRNAQFFGRPQRLSRNLRLLDWMEYPSPSLPSRKVVLLNPSSHRLPKPGPHEIGTMKCCGIHLYNEGMNIHVVSFIKSDLRGSILVYEKVDGALGIYEEEEKEEYGYDYDDLEVEELSPSIKSKERGVLGYSSNADEVLVNKSNKLVLGSSPHAVTIHENEKIFELWRKGKFKEDFNIVQVQASTSTASTSADKDTVLIEIKHNCCDKAERTQIQVPKKRANEEFSQIEDNMESFYASIGADSSALPLLEDTLNLMPSEETKKKVQSLRDLMLKNFSLLSHPGRSGHLKNTLDYLVSLSPEDGISLSMRSAMLQVSTSFSQWSWDYNKASLRLESATESLSNVDKLQEVLECNVKEFREAETFENVACSKLAKLEARKRELEERINAIKAEIADFKLVRDDAVTF